MKSNTDPTISSLEWTLPEWPDPLDPQSGKAALQRGMEDLFSMHREGLSGITLAERRSDLMDDLLTTVSGRFEETVQRRYARMRETFCLVAVGGYGRRELNPHSDIDLLFLHDYRVNAYIESITEKILLLLYDLHLQIGHASRSISDCVSFGHQDTTIRTNLLDSRYVAGNRALYDRFISEMRGKLFLKSPEDYVERKAQERRERVDKFGRTIFQLEPNVKESEGGLRDLHLFRWVIKLQSNLSGVQEALQRGIVTQRQDRDFASSLEFLLKIRNDLHFETGRGEDRLTLESQRKMAERFGYRDDGHRQAVELFMSDYYEAAHKAKTLAEDAIGRFGKETRRRANRFFGISLKRHIGDHFRNADGKIGLRDNGLFESEPVQMMRLFHHIQEENLPMDLFCAEHLRANLHQIDDEYRANPEAVRLWMRMLEKSHSISRVLEEMNDIGFLQAWIPEFSPIHHKVQFDVYHLFTVDIHSIFTVERFERLLKGEDNPFADERLPELAQTIPDKALMSLALLFHDIGKGKGDRHSERGAALIPEIANRWSLSDESAERLAFLVLHHLDLYDTALRRDIHDDRVLEELMETLGDRQTLDMLYILTLCDAHATNPGALTPWKQTLIRALYDRVSDGFAQRGGAATDAERMEERLANLKERLRKSHLPPEISDEAIDRYFSLLPPRYFFSTDPSRVARHLIEEESFAGEDLYLKVFPFREDGFLEAVFGWKDEPGAFNILLGVLAANGISILGANVNTRSDNRIFDILYCEDIHYGAEVNPEKWDRIREQLKRCLHREGEVSELITSDLVERSVPKSGWIGARVKVSIRNDLSEGRTVIETGGPDRLGALYDITKVLAKHGLTIDIAKAVTQGHRFIDVFYVQETDKTQVTDPDKLKALEADLQKAIESPIGGGQLIPNS